MTELKRTNSEDADFRVLLTELDGNLREIYDQLMDVYDQYNTVEKIDTVVIAYQDGEPVGCGCFKHFNEDAAELKRMFVRKSRRGQGISDLILTELEAWAKEKNYIVTILETGDRNIEALGLYRKAGYSSMPNYGPYVSIASSFCFRKRL